MPCLQLSSQQASFFLCLGGEVCEVDGAGVKLLPVFFSNTEERNDFLNGKPFFRVFLLKFVFAVEDTFGF